MYPAKQKIIHPKTSLNWIIFSCVFLLISTLICSYSIYWNHYEAITWITNDKIDSVKINLNTLPFHLFDLSPKADVFYFTREFLGSDILMPSWFAYSYLSIFLIAISLIFASITYLKKYWFYVGMTLVTLFIIACKTELSDWKYLTPHFIPACWLLPILALCYFFWAFKDSSSYFIRFSSFILVNSFWFLLHCFLSNHSNPALFVVSYSCFPVIILAVVAILVVSFDIVYAILYLVSSAQNEDNKAGIINYGLATSIFLANVLLSYLHNAGTIKWDIVYLNAFFLLGASFWIGLWSHDRKFVLFENIISNREAGKKLYIGIVALSIVFCAFIFVSTNDPGINFIQNITIYSQLSIGFIWFIFTFLLLFDALKKNMRAYLMVFTRRRPPFLMLFLSGMVGVGALISYANYYTIYQGFASYHNAVADFWLNENETFIAEQHYKKSLEELNGQHKANYSLACMARKLDDKNLQTFYFKRASYKTPFPQTYSNLNHAFQKNDLFFDALESLHEGKSFFPNSGELDNNLSTLFSTTQMMDSSIYFLKESLAKTPNKSISYTNILALGLAKQKELSKEFNLSEIKDEDAFLSSNSLAYSLFFKQTYQGKIPKLERNDSLNYALKASYYINHTLANLNNSDTTTLDEIKFQISKDLDPNRNELLRAAYAIGIYYKNINRLFALQEMQNLVQIGGTLSSQYANILGVWLLENNVFASAKKSFELAEEKKYPDANFSLFLSEINSLNKSDLKNYSWINDADKKFLIQDFQKIMNARDILELSQAQRYLYFVVNFSKLNDSQKENIVFSLKNPDLIYKAGIYLFDDYVKENKTENLTYLLKKLNQISPSWEEAKLQLNIRELIYSDLTKNYKEVIHASTTPISSEKGIYYYHLAHANEKTGNLIEAKKLYEKAYHLTPFYLLGLKMQTSFLNSNQGENIAYENLLTVYQLAKDIPEIGILYAKQCLKLNLFSYGDEVMQGIKIQMNNENYIFVQKEYNQLKLQMQNKAWE